MAIMLRWTVAAATVLVVGVVGGSGCAKKPGREAAPDVVDILPIIIYDTLTDDRDGKTYKTVKIGDQTWMAENLNYRADSSGCLDDDESNCDKYGRWYDWETALKVCPAGWHLPTRLDWGKLVLFAGDKRIDGFEGTAGKKLKSTAGWGEDKFNGTNEYGFSAIPNGRGGKGQYTDWWTATEYSISDYAYQRGIHAFDEYMAESHDDKSNFTSVRCVQDAENPALQPPSAIRGGRLVDSRDDKKYKIVTMGNKMWMAENLNYRPPTDSSWCYDNQESNCKEYGRLYDWNTAMKSCPAGWHLPTLKEWDNLASYAGGAKGQAGTALKSKWRSIYEYDGTDEYGFSALPGGVRFPNNDFNNADYSGYWWTTEKSNGDSAYFRGVSRSMADLMWGRDHVGYGLSVRCVNDADIPAPPSPTPQPSIVRGGRSIPVPQPSPPPQPSVVKDGRLIDGRDGKKYKTAKINGKTWMAENLNYQSPTGISLCYNDDTSACEKYGRLYDWRTAMKACPDGWHLPTREEWGDLAVFAGGTGEYGDGDDGVAGKKLKSKTGWFIGRAGTNNYGFSALPGGRSSNGSFFYSGIDGISVGGVLGLPIPFGLSDSYGVWWTATEYGCCDKAYYRLIGLDKDMPEYDDEMSDGLSVRCVRDTD